MKENIILAVWILFVIFTVGSAIAETKNIQFSLVLSEEETKTTLHKPYSFMAHKDEKPKDIFVSEEVLLSRDDIESMSVIKKEDSPSKYYPAIDIVFKKKGSDKLLAISRHHLRKNLAIIVGDQVLSTPYILYPLKKGHVLVSTWKIDTNDAAEKFIRDLGFASTLKDSGQRNGIR